MDLLQVRDLKEQKKHLKKANKILNIVNRKSGYNYETLYDFLLYGIDDNNLNYYAWLLKRYGFSYEAFSMLIMASMALYDESMWADNAFIKDFGFDFNDIFLTDLNSCSYHGIKLAEEMGDGDLINSKFGDKLYGNCHDLANYMALKYNLGVETSFVKNLFDNKTVHSYNYDDCYIYDASRNIIMGEEDFKRVNNPKVINKMSLSEFLEKRSLLTDEEKINAVYRLALKRYKK